MKPFRRELLNGLFVLVVGSLISTAFEAFHVEFDIRLWALIVTGVAIAVSGYAVFAVTLGFIASAEERERTWAESTRLREEEWLKRVGTPARLDLNTIDALIETMKAIRPGSDYTIMFYFGAEGPFFTEKARDRRQELYDLIFEQQKRGTIREYKRVICFDSEVLANDHELKTGILRVGQGRGTIDQLMGEHCRLMMKTKNCSLFVAPAVFTAIVAMYGADKVSISVESLDQEAGGRRIVGTLFFSDPPNGEVVEQFRQIERATERRMVAVREIRFPEDAPAAASLASS